MSDPKLGEIRIGMSNRSYVVRRNADMQGKYSLVKPPANVNDCSAKADRRAAVAPMMAQEARGGSMKPSHNRGLRSGQGA